MHSEALVDSPVEKMGPPVHIVEPAAIASEAASPVGLLPTPHPPNPQPPLPISHTLHPSPPPSPPHPSPLTSHPHP